jgi:hypothetical protein
MGTTLFSTEYAGNLPKRKPSTLDDWLRTGAFEIQQIAENSKTREKTHYFTQADINRLVEFAQNSNRLAVQTGGAEIRKPAVPRPNPFEPQSHAGLSNRFVSRWGKYSCIED